MQDRTPTVFVYSATGGLVIGNSYTINKQYQGISIDQTSSVTFRLHHYRRVHGGRRRHGPHRHDRRPVLHVRLRLHRHRRGVLRRDRGGGVVPHALDERDLPLVRAEELLDLDDALSRLEALLPRQASVVELRFFAGLSESEAAEALGVTERTVRRDWADARHWLFDALRSPP